MNKDTRKCYQKSIELLLSNSSKYGVLASGKSKRAVERNYIYIFGRDASICSLGMIASQNKKLISLAKKSLTTLAKHQSKNGQIPNCINPESKYSNFWVMGCIDATLWWLIAIDFYDKNSQNEALAKKLNNNIKQAINWLSCQEHPLDGLLIQNEASDWADIMPRSGKVLYTNALWGKVKKLYKITNKTKTIENISKVLYNLDTSDTNIPICDESIMINLAKKETKHKYYHSFVNYLYWGSDIDVFGNSLVIIFHPEHKERHSNVVKQILQKQNKKNMPMPVLFNPINKSSNLWKKYMESHKQNLPYQYHNGGIWPFASCFWAIALDKQKQKDRAWSELAKIASTNKLNNWEFNEWFHAKNGKALGMKKQSWNAGMFLLAYHILNDDITL